MKHSKALGGDVGVVSTAGSRGVLLGQPGISSPNIHEASGRGAAQAASSHHSSTESRAVGGAALRRCCVAPGVYWCYDGCSWKMRLLTNCHHSALVPMHHPWEASQIPGVFCALALACAISSCLVSWQFSSPLALQDVAHQGSRR
jgi:hypothetical protein